MIALLCLSRASAFIRLCEWRSYLINHFGEISAANLCFFFFFVNLIEIWASGKVLVGTWRRREMVLSVGSRVAEKWKEGVKERKREYSPLSIYGTANSTNSINPHFGVIFSSSSRNECWMMGLLLRRSSIYSNDTGVVMHAECLECLRVKAIENESDADVHRGAIDQRKQQQHKRIKKIEEFSFRSTENKTPHASLFLLRWDWWELRLINPQQGEGEQNKTEIKENMHRKRTHTRTPPILLVFLNVLCFVIRHIDATQSYLITHIMAALWMDSLFPIFFFSFIFPFFSFVFGLSVSVLASSSVSTRIAHEKQNPALFFRWILFTVDYSLEVWLMTIPTDDNTRNNYF